MKKSKKQIMLALLDEAEQLTKAAEEAERPMSDEEKETVREKMGQAMELRDEIKSDEHDAELKAQLAELLDGVKESDQRAEPRSPIEKGTIGEQFVNSQGFEAWMKQVAPNGQIPDGMKRFTSPPVNFKGLLRKLLVQRKDLITGASDTSAGAFVETDYTGIYEPIGYYPLALRDLISVGTTGSDLVEFVRQTQQVTEATTVAEANVTEYSGATGEVSGEKPEGATAWEKVQEPVKTIAVWIPATKRALSDVGQLRSLIDLELREDLEQELEDQVLNGNGVGENFTGLANTAGVLAQAWDTDILRTSRRAITNLLINGRQIPMAWLLNPQDWETVELTQDAEDRYYYGGPMTQATPRLWGVPVAQSFYQPQGTGWLGNWRKARLWDREMATISVSDSHEDFFIRNMVAILAEMRAAFGVIRPSAFVEVDLESGS